MPATAWTTSRPPIRSATSAQTARAGASIITIARTRGGPLWGDGRFDLVFLDPPYHLGWLEKLEPLLSRVLKEDGVIYAEAEKPLESLGDWATVKRGKAGQVFYHLMARNNADAE